MQLFYAPGFNRTDDTLQLPREESAHAIRVLRKKEGDELFVTNGRGVLVRGNLTNANEKSALVHIEEILEDSQSRDYYVHLWVAPTKMNDRMEWLFEKATEIGIDEITPVFCAHSERRAFNKERMEKIILSAAKQSLKATFPHLNEALSLPLALKTAMDGKKFIAHCIEQEHRETLALSVKKGDRVHLLIGPEGDFTPEEVKAAINGGFTPVSLGASRLRTETAALVAVDTISFINQF